MFSELEEYHRWRHAINGLRGDLDPPPESHIPLDFLRRILRRGVKPRRVLVHLSLHHNVVVTRLALPGTRCVRLTLPEVFILDRIRRKIVISFDNNRVAALSEQLVVPHRFHKHLQNTSRGPMSCSLECRLAMGPVN